MEMMHHSLTAATRATHGVRGEALNVTLTSGHGTVSQDTIESMERSWKRHHKEVLVKRHEVITAAVASDSEKKWRNTLKKDEVEYFEPDDYAFPDIREHLDRDDPTVKELNATFTRNGVANLQELARRGLHQRVICRLRRQPSRPRVGHRDGHPPHTTFDYEAS